MKKAIEHTMRAVSRLLIGACLVVFVLVDTGCSGDDSHFVGIWDLRSMETTSGTTMSAEEIEAMRELGIESYLNLDEDGSLSLINFDQALLGQWESTGQDTATATIDGQNATITIQDDMLRMTQQDVTLVFVRGNDDDRVEIESKLQQKPERSAEEQDEIGTETESKTSHLSDMVVRGYLLSEPKVLVDDDICTIVVDGLGVDKWGDPGFNIQITNKSTTNIDVWIKDAFIVDGVPVRTYLCETISPSRYVTSFIQFDTDDLGSTSIGSLTNVTGTILVDNNKGRTIGRYKIAL